MNEQGKLSTVQKFPSNGGASRCSDSESGRGGGIKKWFGILLNAYKPPTSPCGYSSKGGELKTLYVLFLIFVSSPLFAIVPDFTNSCGNYGYNKMYASFVLSSYTCAAGQFLPANTIACVSCPTGYTCAGGTYTFNTTQSQGLVRTAQYYTVSVTKACASNFPHNLNAVFVPNDISLTWQNENGTTMTTNICTYGQPITLPTNPTKPGYKFTGWRVVNN